LHTYSHQTDSAMYNHERRLSTHKYLILFYKRGREELDNVQVSTILIVLLGL